MEYSKSKSYSNGRPYPQTKIGEMLKNLRGDMTQWEFAQLAPKVFPLGQVDVSVIETSKKLANEEVLLFLAERSGMELDTLLALHKEDVAVREAWQREGRELAGRKRSAKTKKRTSLQTPPPEATNEKPTAGRIEIKVETTVELTYSDLGMLLLSPYSRPTLWSGRGVGDRAKELERLGLLESDPGMPIRYRCTEKGEALLAPYLKKRV